MKITKNKRYRKKHNMIEYLVALIAVFLIFAVLKNLLMMVITFLCAALILCYYLQNEYLRKRRYLDSGIQDIDQMSGEEYEQYLKYQFERLGYRVETTAKSHDYGADLVMRKAGERIVVQAKRYNERVGIKAVQEVIGAMAYYKAASGCVVTNNYFTKSACNLAESCGVLLWDRDYIIKSFSIKCFADRADHRESSNDLVCPRCGSRLVQRKGVNGVFVGCSSYPRCTYTHDLRIDKTNREVIYAKYD